MRIEMLMGRDMRDKLFHHLQTLSFSFYNVTPVGYLLARVMSDTNRIAGMIAWNFTDILWALFYVGGSFVSMLLLNWKLALVVIVIVPVMALLTVYFQRKLIALNRQVRAEHSKITAGYNEGIMGAKTSKTMALEDKLCREFEDITGRAAPAGILHGRMRAIYVPLIVLCGTLGASAMLLRGGHMVLDGALSIGSLSAFMTYALGVFQSFRWQAARISQLISLQANIERVSTTVGFS